MVLSWAIFWPYKKRMKASKKAEDLLTDLYGATCYNNIVLTDCVDNWGQQGQMVVL